MPERVVPQPDRGPRPQTILVATDGSPSATEATEFALALAAAYGAQLVFVHVVRTLDYVHDAFEDDAYAAPHAPSAREVHVLEQARERAARAGVAATTALRFGTTVDEIVAFAHDHDVDVIVVGSRGRGRATSALLGSVSLGVLQHSRSPVVIVRGTPIHAIVEPSPTTDAMGSVPSP